MRFLNYYHKYIGRNKNGYLNSYGFYLLKQEQKGDFIFNPWFALFNIFWLLRWRMYALSSLVLIAYIEVYLYFFSVVSELSSQLNLSEDSIISNAYTVTFILLMPIYLFLCFSTYRLLQLKIDASIVKLKFDEKSISKKNRQLNYIWILPAYIIIFQLCYNGLGTLMNIIKIL